jgi:ABC-type polysaccharide/polyol phosphate transport system ATPase subunit
MARPALQVRGLGKQYRYGRAAPYRTLRDQLAELATLPARLLRGGSRPKTFWALRDVSFDVLAGEVVGIVGSNGAGKSTLLKILGRIVEPTEGSADVFGRVGTLLEVGTGFHPELSGRDNVFLNGAILGMKRAEITRRFDAIVAFAEVEDFIDTAVKHYSSGMYMRLAFAVAAHLEPEILVVDEVLAVGDAAFQRKCLGKLGDVARDGRTVLFVSHNLQAIQTLCRTAIHLKAGALVDQGPVADVVARYLRASADHRDGGLPAGRSRPLGPDLEVTALGLRPDPVPSGGTATLALTLRALERTTIHHLIAVVRTRLNERVAIVDLRTSEGAVRLERGESVTLASDVVWPLVEATYDLGVVAQTDGGTGDVSDLSAFEVAVAATPGSRVAYPPEVRGIVELSASPVRRIPGAAEARREAPPVTGGAPRRAG